MNVIYERLKVMDENESIKFDPRLLRRVRRAVERAQRSHGLKFRIVGASCVLRVPVVEDLAVKDFAKVEPGVVKTKVKPKASRPPPKNILTQEEYERLKDDGDPNSVIAMARADAKKPTVSRPAGMPEDEWQEYKAYMEARL